MVELKKRKYSDFIYYRMVLNMFIESILCVLLIRYYVSSPNLIYCFVLLCQPFFLLVGVYFKVEMIMLSLSTISLIHSGIYLYGNYVFQILYLSIVVKHFIIHIRRNKGYFILIGIFNLTFFLFFELFVSGFTPLITLTDYEIKKINTINVFYVMYSTINDSLVFSYYIRYQNKIVSKFRAQFVDNHKEQYNFIKQFSHYLRTELMGVNSFIKEINNYKKFIKNDDDKYKTTLAFNCVNCIVSSIIKTINDVTGSFKLIMFDYNVKNEVVNVNELIRDIVSKQHNIRSENNKIRVKISVEHGCPDFFVVDKNLVEQVYSLLVYNSYKFCEEGMIEVKVGYNEEVLSFCVCDDGAGFTKNILNLIFKNSKKDDQDEGVIITGLIFANQIAKLLKGELLILSNKNGGSCCYFSFKCKEGFKEKKKKIKLLEKDYSKLRILVCDDSSVCLKTALYILGNKLNQDVYTCKNGEECVKFIEKDNILGKNVDLILMDLNMPLLNGIKTTKILRRDYNKDFIIYAFTATVLENIDKFCDENKFDGYCQKPFGIGEFSRILEEVPFIIKKRSKKIKKINLSKSNLCETIRNTNVYKNIVSYTAVLILFFITIDKETCNGYLLWFTIKLSTQLFFSIFVKDQDFLEFISWVFNASSLSFFFGYKSIFKFCFIGVILKSTKFGVIVNILTSLISVIVFFVLIYFEIEGCCNNKHSMTVFTTMMTVHIYSLIKENLKRNKEREKVVNKSVSIIETGYKIQKRVVEKCVNDLRNQIFGIKYSLMVIDNIFEKYIKRSKQYNEMTSDLFFSFDNLSSSVDNIVSYYYLLQKNVDVKKEMVSIGEVIKKILATKKRFISKVKIKCDEKIEFGTDSEIFEGLVSFLISKLLCRGKNEVDIEIGIRGIDLRIMVKNRIDSKEKGINFADFTFPKVHNNNVHYSDDFPFDYYVNFKIASLLNGKIEFESKNGLQIGQLTISNGKYKKTESKVDICLKKIKKIDPNTPFKILVVTTEENEIKIFKKIKEKYKKIDFKIKFVYSVIKAIKFLQTEKTNIIFADFISKNGLNAFNLCSEIKKRKLVDKKVKFFLIQSDVKENVNFKNESCNYEVLLQPITLEKIENIVEKYM